MHTVTVAILGSVAVTVGIRWQFRRLMRFGIATAVILAVTLIGLRVLFATAMRQEFAGADIVYSMRPLLGGAPARARADVAGGNRDAGARRRASTRSARGACCGCSSWPIACRSRFRTARGGSSALDVEMARVLATDLDVDVQFFQADMSQLAKLLAAGVGDIAMSGVVVTPDRAADTLLSAPYLDETHGVRHPRSAPRSVPDLGLRPSAGCDPRRHAGRSGVPPRDRGTGPRAANRDHARTEGAFERTRRCDGLHPARPNERPC